MMHVVAFRKNAAFAVATAILVTTPLLSGADGGAVVKVEWADDAALDKGLDEFRSNLLKAVDARDVERLAAMSIDPFHLPGAPPQGPKQALLSIGAGNPESKIWHELAFAWRHGGGYIGSDGSHQLFCAPKITNREEGDASLRDLGVIMGTDVPIVRVGPNGAKIVERTATDELIMATGVPSTPVPLHSPRDGGDYDYVLGFDGTGGFVESRYFSTIQSYEMCAENIGGEWTLTSVGSDL